MMWRSVVWWVVPDLSKECTAFILNDQPLTYLNYTHTHQKIENCVEVCSNRYTIKSSRQWRQKRGIFDGNLSLVSANVCHPCAASRYTDSVSYLRLLIEGTEPKLQLRHILFCEQLFLYNNWLAVNSLLLKGHLRIVGVADWPTFPYCRFRSNIWRIHLPLRECFVSYRCPFYHGIIQSSLIPLCETGGN
jgi:hypothetical protein